MDRIYLSKSYLKNPIHVISILLIALVIFESFNWTFSFERKLAIVNRFGGIFGYLYVVLRGMIIPEMATIAIIILLLDLSHKVFRIHSVPLSWTGVLRYELTFLPILAISFLFFNPVSQSIRYLLVEFPAYNFDFYWNHYIVGTFTIRVYFMYLILVLLSGYLSLNASLLNDFIKSARTWKYQNPAAS